MPGLFYKLGDCITVITQLDMFYTRQIGEFIDNCLYNGIISQNSDLYGWDLHDDLTGELVFPRIWDGGIIVNTKTIVDFIDNYNIGLGFTWHSAKSVEIANEHRNLYIHLQGKNVYLQELIKKYSETLFEFSLFCYHFGLPVNRIKYITHMPRPEAVARENPTLYKALADGDIDLATKSFNLYNNGEGVGGALLMYYLSGVTEWHSSFINLFMHHRWIVDRMEEINASVEIWMKEPYLQRWRKAYSLIGPRFGILL